MLIWIVRNRTVFDFWTVYLCLTELLEIELFICMKMDLALNNPTMFDVPLNQTKLIMFNLD